MSRLAKGIEIFANIGIIVASSFIVLLLYHSALFRSSTASQVVKSGEHIAVNGYNWSSHKKTYVLALQVGCQFCTRSAPAFRQLSELAAQENDVGMIAVLPQSTSTSTKYVEELGIKVPIFQANLSTLRVIGTPTVILCDNRGTVAGVWVGLVDTEKETQIASTIKEGE